MTATDTAPAPAPGGPTRSPAPAAGNAATVAEIYAAFGRGDVPAILARLAPEVAWDLWPRNYAQEAAVLHLAPRRGRAEVAHFFVVIGGWGVRAFDVQDLIGSGDQVVGQIHAEFDLPGGGRSHDEELHLWTFDEHGLVRAFRTTPTPPSTSPPRPARPPRPRLGPDRTGDSRRHVPVVPGRNDLG